MKKFALALMCAVSVLLLASCSKKGKEENPATQTLLPKVEFVNAGEGYVYENTTVQLDEPVGYKILATATDEKDLLTEFNLTVTAEIPMLDTILYHDTTITIKKEKTFVYEEEPEAIGLPAIITINATVKTAANCTASKEVEITCVEPALEVHDLSWVRVGGSPATGLEEFGLRWESNYKDICASIRPLSGAIMYKFDGVDFASVTGETEKMILFAEGQGGEQITEFHEISCEQQTSTFNHVIGTVYNGQFFLINLTNATVEAAVAGTTVTINGQWK